MSLLRQCSAALDLALRGGVELFKADLFQFTTSDGAATYYWTSWSKDQTIGGHLYISNAPWIKRGRWNLTNTMEVPSCTVTLLALNDGFQGGANIKLQSQNGLFDGATFLLSRVYMPVAAPDDVTTLGTIDIMAGRTGPATINGNSVILECKGKSDLLNQEAPRNVFQVGCLHAFCDLGCTLSRTDFTFPFTAGATDISTQFVPWTSPPAEPQVFVNGTLTMISGAASGQQRTIVAADSTGVTLVYPLYELPTAGDTFTAFQGCSKNKDDDSGQSCTDYDNLQNFRAFPFVPPPNAAY